MRDKGAKSGYDGTQQKANAGRKQQGWNGWSSEINTAGDE